VNREIYLDLSRARRGSEHRFLIAFETSESRGDIIKDWIIYILECSDKTYYTGITNNLSKRIKLHQKGMAARYTAQRLPVRLSFYKSGYTQSEARKEEMVLKDWSREKKIKLIKGIISRS